MFDIYVDICMILPTSPRRQHGGAKEVPPKVCANNQLTEPHDLNTLEDRNKEEVLANLTRN